MLVRPLSARDAHTLRGLGLSQCGTTGKALILRPGRLCELELRVVVVVLSEREKSIAAPSAGWKVSSWGFSCPGDHCLGIPCLLKFEFQRVWL